MDNLGDGLNLREALKEDCRDLWIWRNHPDVRRSSFNERPILWHEHKKWFNAKIQDRDIKIYVATFKKSKVGVIRFGVKKNDVLVSVNLNPEFFGRGLGTKIIKLGTEKFMKETKIHRPIFAEIKKENIASFKAFLKAGYKFDREIERENIYKLSKD